MHAIQVSGVAVCTEAPASALTEERLAYTSLDLLADCVVQERVPLIYKILSLMDIEEPVQNLTYLDSHIDLYNFGYNDTIQLFGLDESLLSSFGLGTENARHVHQFIQDRFLEPLGLMVTSTREPPSTPEVAAPTAPTIQDLMQHENGVRYQAITEEDIEVWLTIPSELDEVSKEGEIEVDEDKIEEDELEDKGSDVESVTTV
ncbi:hypothetical protein EDB92DRAFT_1820508 [Lactarius akahatsu]|uniref:Uncharacterized protein n=1 Tax=Lactarius akahatsu TaxID=416441 RepID=A0AAD4Q8G7_9AGAM|nr:hypothetical protein EDB92DRAFT_1820508 [Lactarius akahatsu]